MEGESIFSNDLDEYITNDGKEIPFERSFASYEGKTEKGKFKKDCWVSEKNNGLTPRDITLHNGGNFWFQQLQTRINIYLEINIFYPKQINQ